MCSFKRYIIRCSISKFNFGAKENFIDAYNKIIELEEKDRLENKYIPDRYEIYDRTTGKII